MNVTQLVNAVYSKGYSFTPPTSGPADPTNPALIELNTAYREICGARRWPFLETIHPLPALSAGVYALPLTGLPDLRSIDAVRLTDAFGNTYDTQNMEPQDLRGKLSRSQYSQSCPKYWTQYAGQIMFYPVPDAAYTPTVDYVMSPPDLAAATDIPVLPVQYHDVLVWGAVQYLAYRERNIWAQELAMGYYRDAYQKMENEYNLMQRQTSSRVKRSGFNDYSSREYMFDAGS